MIKKGNLMNTYGEHRFYYKKPSWKGKYIIINYSNGEKIKYYAKNLSHWNRLLAFFNEGKIFLGRNKFDS